MILLWLLFLTSIEAYVCPDGYRDGLDGNCYSGPFNGIWTRNEGYEICASSNAYLYTVNNFFDNQRIIQNAGSISFVYLGITCIGSEITSCQWDTGKDIELGDFTNFYDGKPNAIDGACVIMNIKNGFWYSVDCSEAYNVGIECKYTPGIDIPNCLFDSIFGYTPHYFRGKCYFLSNVRAVTDGTKLCRDAGGDMASIHSAGENSFVGGLAAQYMSNFTYMNLGLQWNGGNYI